MIDRLQASPLSRRSTFRIFIPLITAHSTLLPARRHSSPSSDPSIPVPSSVSPSHNPVTNAFSTTDARLPISLSSLSCSSCPSRPRPPSSESTGEITEGSPFKRISPLPSPLMSPSPTAISASSPPSPNPGPSSLPSLFSLSSISDTADGSMNLLLLVRVAAGRCRGW